MNPCTRYTPEELNLQYNVRAARPDFDEVVVPRWMARSEEVRRRLLGDANAVYGPAERERLDFFPAADHAGPILIFFHGGYWQRFDKSVFSFVAEPFVASGISVAVVNYTLCPEVGMEEILAQANRAVTWVTNNSERLWGRRGGLYLMGHSAGAHIAAMLMSGRMRGPDPGISSALLRGCILISGLFELAPLVYTYINAGLGLDDDRATALSPVNNLPVDRASMLVACGARESAEFHRQSDSYATAVRSAGVCEAERFNVPGCDHMDVVDEIARADSIFFRKARDLILNSHGRSCSDGISTDTARCSLPSASSQT